MAKVTIPSLIQVGNPGGRIGPYVDGSNNLWVVGFLTSTFRMTAYKSSDNGATWATNFPCTTSPFGGSGTMDTVYDPTNQIIYVIADVGGSHILQVWSFTIATTTWAEVYSSGTRPTANPSGAVYPGFITLRSTGEIVVVYQGPTHSVMGTNYGSVYYQRLSAAGVWSAAVEADDGSANVFGCKGACLGASDRVHMALDGPGGVNHRSLDSTNVLDTMAVAVATTPGATTIYYHPTLGKVVVAAGGGGAGIARANSVATPTWTADTNSPGTTSNAVASPPVFVYNANDSKLYIFYVDNTTTDVFVNTSTGNTWGTAAVQDVAGTAAYISARYISNAIGVVWSDSGFNFDKFLFIGPKPVSGTVAATSTVSGSLRQAPRVRQLPAATINATSTVGGPVTKRTLIKPANKNLITNPSFEVDLSGWQAYVNPGIIQNDFSRSTAWAIGNGTHSAHFKWTNAADTTTRWGELYWPGVNLAALPILPGIPYTVSAYINVVTIPVDGQVGITLNWYDIAGTQLSGSAAGVVNATAPGVTRVVATGTPPINAVYMVAIIVNGTAVPSGVTEYYADGVQLEVGSVVTPYVDNKNLIANPSFEIDASGWSVIGVAGGTIAKSSAQKLFGGSSGLVTCVAGNDIISYGGDTGALQLGMVPGQTYTYSIYVWIPSAQAGSFNIAPQIFDNDGSGYATTTGVSAGGVFDQWIRVQVTRPIRAGSNEAFLRLVAFGATAGQIFYIEGAQLEIALVATPYTQPDWILAFSTVSGAVSRLKALATAAVAATSTVSGKLQALRRVTPANVAATSTVGGSVRAIHRITPTTTIAATSTVSGNVVALRKIIPTTIAATSTVSGSIGRLRKVVTGTISATSTVGLSSIQGAFVVIRALKFGTISATSTVAGVLSKQAGVTKPLPAAAIAATSTVSGSVSAIHLIRPAIISATSTVAGSVRAIHLVKPTVSISATSTVAGILSKAPIKAISGVIAATSTVSGAIGRLRPIVPTTIAATSVVSGSVRPLRRVAPANVLATSTVNGTVAKLPLIKPATVAATSTVSGTLAVIHKLVVGNISATSSCAGLLRVARAIRLANIAATSTVSGAVGVIHRITPTAIIAATSTITGSIYKHGIQVMSGSVVNAISTVSGALRVIRAIRPVSISATSTVSGSLIFIRRLPAANILATSTVTGGVRRLRPITPAQVSATSTVSGKLVFIRRLPVTNIAATSVVTGGIVIKRRIVITNVFATSTVHGSLAKLRLVPFVGNIFATSTVAGTLVAKTPGATMYFHQMGTVTHGKTGRIDYVTTGNHTAGKVGRIEPLTTGRAIEEVELV